MNDLDANWKKLGDYVTNAIRVILSEHGIDSVTVKQVVGAISDAAKEYMKGGIGGETRADRWLFHHHNAKPEELLKASKKFGKSFKSFADAAVCIESFRRRYQFQKEERFAPEFIAAGDVKRLYDFFNKYQLAPHLRVHEPMSRIIDDLAMWNLELTEDKLCLTKKHPNLLGSTRRKQSQRRLRKSPRNNCVASPMSAGRLL